MTDPRVRQLDALAPELAGCPVPDCHLGPYANVYRVLLVGPDGRQRAAWGCVKHLAGQLEIALEQIRVEPFDPSLDPLDLSPR